MLWSSKLVMDVCDSFFVQNVQEERDFVRSVSVIEGSGKHF